MAVTRITPPAQLARNVTQDFLEEIHAAGTNGVPVARNGVPLKRQKFFCEFSAGALSVSATLPWAHGVWDSANPYVYAWSADSETFSADFGGGDYTADRPSYYAGRDKSAMRSIGGEDPTSLYYEFGDPLDDPGGIYCFIGFGPLLSPWLGARTIIDASNEPPEGFPEGRWAMGFRLTLEPTAEGAEFPDAAATFRVEGDGWLASDEEFRRIRRGWRNFSPWSLSTSARVTAHTDGWDSYREQMGGVFDTCAAAARREWLSVAAGISASLRVADSADYNLNQIVHG